MAARGNARTGSFVFLVTGMYAIIRTGGKQHRVAENDRIIVERLAAAPGDAISFDDILLLAGTDATPLIGAQVPGAARVFGEVLAQQRGAKIIVFKKKRRQNYRRLRGHRQEQTVVLITGISADGTAPQRRVEMPAVAEAPPPATAAEPPAEAPAEAPGEA